MRHSDTNFGVSKNQIAIGLQATCDDAEMWIRETVFPAPEAAARFHHRIVSVHPFPNGNGRHARLAGDVLLYSLGHPRLSWGGNKLDSAGRIRAEYIDALRAADEGSYEPLLRFLGLDSTLFG